MKDDDEILLERAMAGEMAAYTELFERARPLLRGRLLRLIDNWHDVEDRLQDLFLKAFAKIGEFRCNSKLSTWLFRLAANLHYDDLRREKPHRKVPIDEHFREEQVRSALENPETGRTRRGGRIERYSPFCVDENEQENGKEPEEFTAEEIEGILHKALAGLTVREQEVIKLLFFSHKRVRAKPLAEKMGFPDCTYIYEITRKFKKLCFKAREDVIRSRTAPPPVDHSP